MENYIHADDYELWMIIVNGPYIPMKTTEDGKTVAKKPKEFDSEDFKKMEKNTKAKKLLYFGLRPDEYTRISKCESIKEIWNALRVAHERTIKFKKFFKKAKGNIKKGSTRKPRNSDHDQFSGCFRCEKPDHFVKN